MIGGMLILDGCSADSPYIRHHLSIRACCALDGFDMWFFTCIDTPTPTTIPLGDINTGQRQAASVSVSARRRQLSGNPEPAPLNTTRPDTPPTLAR